MATALKTIEAKMKKLQAQADALATKETAKILKTIRQLMEEHGLTAADIGGYAGGKGRAKKVGAKTVGKQSAATAKYRDPKTGATWTGHGRAPNWIASAKNRDRFLIDGATTATTKPAIAGKVKAANKKASKVVGQREGKGQPKGSQPAKYRDPKSAATWSGRGPAPAWLSGAKDRTKFLINGVSRVADSGSASKLKAVAKKPATKTAVAKKAPADKLVGAKKAVTKLPVATAPEAVSAQATA